jgi:hypothetical protein
MPVRGDGRNCGARKASRHEGSEFIMMRKIKDLSLLVPASMLALLVGCVTPAEPLDDFEDTALEDIDIDAEEDLGEAEDALLDYGYAGYGGYGYGYGAYGVGGCGGYGAFGAYGRGWGAYGWGGYAGALGGYDAYGIGGCGCCDVAGVLSTTVTTTTVDAGIGCGCGGAIGGAVVLP